MKGYYRVWIQRRRAPHDWELVSGTEHADEAHATALHWEQMTDTVGVRVDVCIRYWHEEGDR